MDLQLDANKVIDNLSNQVANNAKEIAILQAQIAQLVEVNEKQQELISAYEDKDEAQKDNQN